MRIDLSSLQDMDRRVLTACGVMLAAGVLIGLMFMDLSKKASAAESLNKEVGFKEQQAEAVPKLGIAEGTSRQQLERFSAFVISPSEVPQLLEEVTRLASENNLSDVTVTSEEHAAIPSTEPETPVLQSLSIKGYLTITVSFKSEYEDAARFTGAIEHLPKPLMVRGVNMRRDPPRVLSTITMQAYEKIS